MGITIVSDNADNYQRLFGDSLVAKITANLNKNFQDVRYDLSVPNDSFFFSDMFFLTITANSSAEKSKTIELVVKRPPRNEFVRHVTKSDAQFHNEILFYKRYTNEQDHLPRCHYTDEQPLSDSLIVLENISKSGYNLCEWRYDVPFEYTAAAMKQVARFHAKGYMMKERHAEKFFSIVKDIQETRLEDSPDNAFLETVNITSNRAVDYLRKQGHDKDLCDKLDAYLEDSFHNVMLKAAEPDEPLSTLCHGDFTLNNVFFKKENGTMKAMLIDFAMMRYGTPVIDLSTYLCLHCASELDKDLIEKSLKVYHESLRECLMENGIEDYEKYSYEALCDDYKKKGMFGFIIASFFLSITMGSSDTKIEAMETTGVIENAKMLREAGGDEINKILARMLLKLKDFGCLDHVL